MTEEARRPPMQKGLEAKSWRVWTPNGLHMTSSATWKSAGFPATLCFIGVCLVDLKGFEPLTSSMPFKKYQSLTGALAKNKRLSNGHRGLQWTPRGSTTRTPDPQQGTGTRRAFARAVAGCDDCCLLEQTTTDFYIRRMPKWNAKGRRRGDLGCGYGRFTL